jgi:Stress responsive A/B Barrel Domain
VLRHVALFRWTAESTDEQRSAVAPALAELPGLIPELRDYRFGPDAGLAPGGNYDFAVVADLDSVDDYRAYSAHPAHVRVLTEVVRPIVADRAAVQFEL